MVDLRYIMLTVVFLIFGLAGVILIAIDEDNLEAAIPLFAPAFVALVAMGFLAFIIKDEYATDGAGGPLSVFRRKRDNRGYDEREKGYVESFVPARSKYDDGRTRYDDGRTKYTNGGGGGRSKYTEDRSRSPRKERDRRNDRGRYDEERTRYDDQYASPRPKKGGRKGGGRTRYGDSRY